MHLDDIKNKRVLVVGLGVTGESVVRFLHKHGVAFDVADERSEPSAQLQSSLSNSQFYKRLDASLCTAYELIVISPGVPRALPALQAALAKGIAVIGDIELFACAIGNQAVIAVTGSNGKSTVVSWIAHVLQRCGKRVKLCGNIGMPALDSIDEAAELYVLELSSYQLESTASLKTLSAAVLNISDDHMDRYESIDDYAAVKRRVYAQCEHKVVNLDDVRTFDAGDVSCSTTFSVSPAANADYFIAQEEADAWLCHGERKVIQRVQLQTPGDHNVANALAVLALLEPVGLDAAQLVNALSEFKGLEHRTEFVLEHNGVRWFNDSKGTNIDACEKAILAMGAPVVLIAGGLGKGADFNALRTVVEQQVKAVVLIGEDAKLIESALSGTTHIEAASSLDDAVQRCIQLAEQGDAVLLSPACSSFDMFDNFEQRGIAFKKAVEVAAA